MVCPVQRNEHTPTDRLELIQFYESELGQSIYSWRSKSIEPLIEHIKNLSQNYLSTDDHKTGELYQSKVVLCLLFIPCEQFSEPVVP